MTSLPLHYRTFLRYVFALVTVVVVGATTLIGLAYVTDHDSERVHNRIFEFHLPSLALSATLMDSINSLRQSLSTATAEASPTGVNPSVTHSSDTQFIGTQYLIRKALRHLSELEEKYGDESSARVLNRAIDRFDRVSLSLARTDPLEVLETEIDMLALNSQQLDRLHSIATDRLIRQLDERSSRHTAILGGSTVTIACVTAILIWWLVVLLRKSFVRQIEVEEELSESRQRLEHIQKLDALGQLVGGVAHDFNNLLTAILQQTELLLSGPREREHYQAGLHEIQNAGEQAASLTRQLLTFSRRQPVERKIVDLNILLENLEPMLRRLIGENIVLRVDYEPDLAPAELDSGQIDQMLLNLVVNARDAMPDGGILNIRTFNLCNANDDPKWPGMPVGRYCGIAVEDNGVGMAPETRSRLFEPFFTTKDKGRGTGLGLSTVHGIVTGSDGYIFVDSELGEGSRFEVYFPRCISPTEAVSPESRGGPMAVTRGGETVLVIEDEEPIRRVMAAGLTKLGYGVRTAASGSEALAICSEKPDSIDVIVSDVVMPDMNGPEVVQRALEFQRNALVIYMSGYTDDIVLKSGVSTTEIAFLNKPFKLEELASLIRDSLDQRLEEATSRSA